jgi:osmoprotectant transport system substrate-binding protein
MRLYRKSAVGVALVALLLAGACGSSKKKTTTTGGTTATTAANKPAITVASFNFGESQVLAQLYAQSLQAKGYKITFKDKLGNREVVEPALERGEIDLVPEYAATVLEFLNKGAGEASSDLDTTIAKLSARYKDKGVTVAKPSTAQDGNAFAVTQATADKLKLKTLSDAVPVAGQIVLGGPPECPQRPFCQAGLKSKYGLIFKSFKSTDAGGPLTKAALDNGDIQMGLIFSSDASIAVKHYVVLADDKKLQATDNVVPVIRTDKATDEVKSILDKVSAALDTNKLVALNKSVDVDHLDPADVAKTFLKDNSLI